jgi:hypothetical protein
MIIRTIHFLVEKEPAGKGKDGTSIAIANKHRDETATNIRSAHLVGRRNKEAHMRDLNTVVPASLVSALHAEAMRTRETV